MTQIYGVVNVSGCGQSDAGMNQEVSIYDWKTYESYMSNNEDTVLLLDEVFCRQQQIYVGWLHLSACLLNTFQIGTPTFYNHVLWV